MPKPISNIADAAAICFHLNIGSLLPEYIVLRSEHRNEYTISSHRLFQLNRADYPSDDWVIALNLTSAEIMSLMGLVPPNPCGQLEEDTESVLQYPSLPHTKTNGDNIDACSP